MQLSVIGRWMAREWSRAAPAWLIGLAAVLLGPICQLTGPVGVVSIAPSSAQYLNSIWFLSTYFGAIVGLYLMARGGSIWRELPPGRQVAVGGLLILGVCLVHGLASRASLLALGGSGLSVGAAELWCAAHWAVLAIFLVRCSSSLAGNCIALTCLGWWIPALLDGTHGWSRVAWALSPERHLAFGGSSMQASMSHLLDTIPLVAWSVAAAMLPTGGDVKR